MTWVRQRTDQMGWLRFESWLLDPPPDAKPDRKVLEQEGAAFLAFMGAAGSVPDGGGGDDG